MQTLLKNTQAYTLLKNEGKSNRFGHAYLLLIDDARNLRFALKTFAKLFFNCADDLSPEKSRIARLIDEESFSDCIMFPAEGKKLSVEDVEKIREESMLEPIESEKKLFLLGDFAEANIQTQNKLLKLLEEPPKSVRFLIGATSVFPVLPTVLSRTKKLEILPFGLEETADCLARMYKDGYDRQTLSLCAAASGGNVGGAQNILEGGHYKTLSEYAFELCTTPLYSLPITVRKIGESKRQKELLSLLRIIFRDALLLKTQARAANYLLLKAEKAKLLLVAKQYSTEALLYAQEALSEAELQVSFNAVFPQCIELCIAKIRSKN